MRLRQGDDSTGVFIQSLTPLGWSNAAWMPEVPQIENL
jgi:hypothetical protein